jgi:TRAP-type transport system periplasmic protein
MPENTRRAALVAAVSIALVSASAVAQEVQLKFAAWGPPQAPMNRNTAEWAEMVNRDGAGVVKVTVFWNTLGNAATVYDNIKNGVADAGWVLQPLVPGKFPKTSVVELPGLFKSSEEASTALWKLYESGFLKDEYDEVRPLAIVPMTGNRIHTKVPIDNVAALAGKKYRVAGRTLGDVIGALGGTGIQMAWTDIHQSLEKGVIQGTLSPWNDFVPAKFPEVTKYHLDHDFGMIAGLVAMNRRAYDALPANAKAIVDKHSGMALTLWLSREADKNMAMNREQVAKSPGHQVFTLPPAEAAQMQARFKPVVESWKQRTKGGAETLKALGKE